MSEVERTQAHMVLSMVAGIMVLVIATLGHVKDAAVEDVDRRVLAAALIVACALGISMAVRPNWWRQRLCEQPVGPGGAEGGTDVAPEGPPRRGHHPLCEPFRGHTLSLGGKDRCAGCTGLAAGSVLVIVLSLVYAAYPDTMEWLDGLAMAYVGTMLVVLTLFTAAAGGVESRASLGLNFLMVLGFGMVAVGLLESTGELAWGLVGVVLSALWMDTRIMLSRWNHATVCTVCPEECVAYRL
jgi:hypothetical protein